MYRRLKGIVWICSLALTLIGTSSLFASQAPATKEKAAKATTKAAPASGPSEKEISDAKAKGLVWVNTSSKVYHKEGQFYGKTKNGQFMTEPDAQKAGYRPAASAASAKKSGTSASKNSETKKK